MSNILQHSPEMTICQVNENIETLRKQLCAQYQMRRGMVVPNNPWLIYCTCCGISPVNTAHGQNTCIDCQKSEGM